MQINLSPARGTNEPYQVYRSRRRANNMRVKQYLLGRYVHRSCHLENRLEIIGAKPEYDDWRIVPDQGTLVGKCPTSKNDKRVF